MVQNARIFISIALVLIAHSAEGNLLGKFSRGIFNVASDVTNLLTVEPTGQLEPISQGLVNDVPEVISLEERTESTVKPKGHLRAISRGMVDVVSDVTELTESTVSKVDPTGYLTAITRLTTNVVSGVTNIGGTAISALGNSGDFLRYQLNEVPDRTPRYDDEYDFIIVGAGSAGSVIASRLTENPDISVLLIEAGGHENLILDIPVLVFYLQLIEKYNWDYRTEPSDDYCLGIEGKRCRWPRGKVMGGSSVLNFMMASRGNRRDYDLWAEQGNSGWSYEEVLPYFKKLENIQVPHLRRDTEFRGMQGPLNITYSPYHSPLAHGFLKAGLELGYNVTDYNGKSQIGFSYLQTNTYNGERESNNRAYLHPVRDRRNLHVTMNSLVSKIVIDPVTKRAIGVEFKKGLMNIRVRARKEVILCAGAIGSPQLLMLSGIGPAEHLSEIGIEPIQDAPVGENLMDHIFYTGLIFTVNTSEAILTENMINPSKSYMNDYLTDRTGPLSLPGSAEALAFVDVHNRPEADGWPNIEIISLAGSLLSDPGIRQSFGIDDVTWKENFEAYYGRHSWYIAPVLLRPKSKGKILLKDNDVNSHPRIIPNYLSHKEDVDTMVKGIRMAIKIGETEPMRKLGSQLIKTTFPRCKKFKYDSDRFWKCAARYLSLTLYHPCGTCKMGPNGDPSAVVDPRLQVQGVDGLRVADASIMPTIPASHHNLVTTMIAEKMSDMLLEDWGYQ